MIRVRYSDLVFELADVCTTIRAELQQQLLYYRASAYKNEAIVKIDERVDQLRAIFQIFSDANLNDALADHDAVWAQGPQLLEAGDCIVSQRISILIAGMNPALVTLTRRFAQSQTAVRPETLAVIKRHRGTLIRVCAEGSRAREILRSL
jgi:hypothetical protein